MKALTFRQAALAGMHCRDRRLVLLLRSTCELMHDSVRHVFSPRSSGRPMVCLQASDGGADRGADTERGAEQQFCEADLDQVELAGHVVGDPLARGLVACLGIRTGVPDAEGE